MAVVIHLEDLPFHLIGGFQHGSRLTDARIGDQKIDRTQMRQCLLYPLIALEVLFHIQWKDVDVFGMGALLFDLLENIRPSCRDQKLGTHSAESLCRCFTDAGGSTGDPDLFTFETTHWAKVHVRPERSSSAEAVQFSTDPLWLKRKALIFAALKWW